MKCSGIDVIVYILPEMCGLVYLDIFFNLEEISEEYTKRCIPMFLCFAYKPQSCNIWNPIFVSKRFIGVMVSGLRSSAVDRGLESQ
jgi:hypothetical protein